MENIVKYPAAILIALLSGLCVAADGQEANNARSLIPEEGIERIETLEQNWSHEEARWFYDTPQGSLLVPYQWYLALEQPENDKPFNAPEHVRSMGFLPRTPDSYSNPDGLPIGFVRDAAYPDGSSSLGLTCAACHTSQINHNGVGFIIDGAPTQGDLETLQRSLHASLQNTMQNNEKFQRFSERVLHNTTPNEIAKLKTRLSTVEKQRREYNERNLPASDAARFGYGRVDAFGAILNEITGRFLRIETNVRPANAPVSYPFLWDTPQHNMVQWNGISKNSVSPIAAPIVGTKHVGALGRNTGEVLGVFAELNLNDEGPAGGYTSTVNQRNLIQLEEQVRKLWSPVWLDEFGVIDVQMRQKGRGLFNEHCAKCHTNDRAEYRFDRRDPRRSVRARLRSVGTDPTMYLNMALRKANTGVLIGRNRKLISSFDQLHAEESAKEILDHVVRRVIVGPVFEPEDLDMEQLAALEPDSPLTISFQTSEGVLSGEFIEVTAEEGKSSFLVTGNNIEFAPNSKQDLPSKPLRLVVGKNGVPHFQGPEEAVGLGSFHTLTLEESTEKQRAIGPRRPRIRVESYSVVARYKARTLNGVWATAPFLHNGSIPNLWVLLQPAKLRPKTFFVGRRDFDVLNVGFQCDSGPFEFDTSLTGNSNLGHLFGTTLTDMQKRQLIEFVKSL